MSRLKPCQKIFRFVAAMSLVLGWGFLFCQAAHGWSELKTTHFIVYYQNTSLDEVSKIAISAEDIYSSVTENLGMRRFNFWLWENRAKIYIYDNEKDYARTTNRPSWSAGFTVARTKTIHTFAGAKGLAENTLSHEIGHIVFREAVGFTNQAVPIWLEEGVASLQEYPDFSKLKGFMKKEAAKGNVVSLEKLISIDPGVLSHSESGQPLYQQAIQLFYLESTSIVAYLIDVFGKEAFNIFCRELKDKRNFDRALSTAYRIKNTQELFQQWKAYLKEPG